MQDLLFVTEDYAAMVGEYAFLASAGAIAINIFTHATASGSDAQTGTDPVHLIFAVQGIGLTAQLNRMPNTYATFADSLGLMNLHIDPPEFVMDALGSSLEIESDEAELLIGNLFYVVCGLCAFSIIHILWIRFYNWKIRKYVGLLRVASGPGIDIQSAPKYPGDLYIEEKHRYVEPGEELYFKRIEMVEHELDDGGTWDIAFYQLRDGRGWIHDFQLDDESVRHIEVLEELTPLNIRPGLRYPQFQYLLVLLMLQGLLQSSMGVLKEGAGLYVFSGAVIVLAFCVGFIIIMAYILRKNFVDLGEDLKYEPSDEVPMGKRRRKIAYTELTRRNICDLTWKGRNIQLGFWKTESEDAEDFVRFHGILFTRFRKVNLSHFTFLIDAALKVVLVVILTMLRELPQAMCVVVFMLLLLIWRVVSVPFVEPKSNRNAVIRTFCELLAMMVPTLFFAISDDGVRMEKLALVVVLIQLVLILFNIVELLLPGFIRIVRFCRMVYGMMWIIKDKPRYSLTTHEFIMPSVGGGASPIQVKRPLHAKKEIDKQIEKCLIECADHIKSELETPAGPIAEYQQGFARRAVAWAKEESAALVAGSDSNTPPIGIFHYSGLHALKLTLPSHHAEHDGEIGTAVNEIRLEIIDLCEKLMLEFYNITVSCRIRPLPLPCLSFVIVFRVSQVHPAVLQEISQDPILRLYPAQSFIISTAVGLGIKYYLDVMIPELADRSLQDAIDEDHHTPEYLKGNYVRDAKPSSVRRIIDDPIFDEKPDSTEMGMSIEFVTPTAPVLWGGSGFVRFDGPRPPGSKGGDGEVREATATLPEQPAELKGTPWEQHADPESGGMFYYNTETEETSWSHPFEKLPDGWSKHIDPESGETFYYHEETEETSWTLPEGTVQMEDASGDGDEFDSVIPQDTGEGRPTSSASGKRVVPVLNASS